MIKIKVKEKEYSLKFGYKSFKKSGILHEVVAMQKKMKENGGEDAEGNIDMLEKVLDLNSKLVAAALQKNHEEFRAEYGDEESEKKVINMVDDLMDDYMDEEDSMSIMDLFEKLMEELFDNGFLSKKSESLEESLETQDATIIPMDHKQKEN